VAEQMRALTIQQPWADAIVLGPKRVENRSWPAPRRLIGQEVALHAGKKIDRHADFPPGCLWMAMPECRPFMSRLGMVLAVATLTGCHRASDCGGRDRQDGRRLPRRGCSPWSMPDQYHWEFDDIRPLADPVPCKGAQRLWRLPEDVEAAVRAQFDGKEDTRG
jgi:ASCH domain